MRILGFLLLSFCFCGPLKNGLAAETRVNSGPLETQAVEAAFKRELTEAAKRVLPMRDPKAAQKISRIKNINDSYRLTGEAVWILAEKGDLTKAAELLHEAVRLLDGNRLAYLLRGEVFEQKGNIPEAGKAYQDYYRNSLSTVPVENQLIPSPIITVFNRYVELRLKTWGMPVPETKISRNVHTLRALTMLEYSEVPQKLNLFIPMLTVGGFALLLLLRVTRAELHRDLWYFLISFYGLIVAGYGIWALHFFYGLPFWRSPGFEFKMFFIGGAVLILSVRAARYFRDRYEEDQNPDSKRCRRCGQMNLRLAVQCERCGSAV